MKSLVSFINESVQKGSKGDSIKANEYLKILNKDNALTNAINSLVDSSNKLLTDVNKVADIEFIDAQSMGRIFEILLAKAMKSINGFEFEHGNENENQPDIVCKKVGTEVSDIKTYDIELKSTSDKAVSFNGNAEPKNAFYIFIKYNAEKSGRYISKINSIEACFGHHITGPKMEISFATAISKYNFIKI